MDYSLLQDGRASVEFLVDLRRQSDALEQPVLRFAEQAGLVESAQGDPSSATTAGRMESAQAVVAPAMQRSRAFRVLRLMRDWTLDQHGPVAMAAFEQISAELAPQLRALQSGPTDIRYAPDLVAPTYWDGVEFHRTSGGWDGHEFMGFIYGEIIHRKMVGDTIAEAILQVRRDTAAIPPLSRPTKILEMGCGSAQYTLGLAAAWPDSELWACDLSPRQLEQAQRRANERGLHWNLFVAAAENTGLAAEDFDLVTSFAIFHELPTAAAEQVLGEACRLLKPGGYVLMADVRAYHVQDDWTRWKADFWNQIHGGDPYWREYATTDLAAAATRAGFVDARWFGVEPDHYPFVLLARKQ